MTNKILLISLLVYLNCVGYHGAGIIPYAVNDGKLYFLLGIFSNGLSKDPKKFVSYYSSYFGGTKKPGDNENPYFTASREASEQLFFIFDPDIILEKWNKITLKKTITFDTFYKKIKHLNTPKIDVDGFYIYFVPISYCDEIYTLFLYRDIYKNRDTDFPDHKLIVDLKWIPMEKLLDHLMSYKLTDLATQIKNEKIFDKINLGLQ